MTISNIDGKIYLALRARLEDWGETYIHLPMTPLRQQATPAWLGVDPVVLESDVAAIDFECGRDHLGFLNVRVMTPVEWDYAASSGLLGRFSDFMQEQRRLEYADCVVNIYRQPQAAGTPRLEINMNRQDLRVYWRAWG